MKTIQLKSKIFVVCSFFLFLVHHVSIAQKVSKENINKVISYTLKNEGKPQKEMEELVPYISDMDTTIYVAKFKKGGFIILSANHCAPPVLGSCMEGEFNTRQMPGGLLYLIETYQKTIKEMINNNTGATKNTAKLWDKYLAVNDDGPVLKSTQSTLTSVQPLLNTEWDQGVANTDPFYGPTQSSDYNRFCPAGCKAGCVAIAMAQVLYYWKWDVDQTGSNTSDGITVNFGNELYCWGNMSPTSPDNHNAKLILHAGISCSTDYCALGSMSGSDMGSALYGFINFWGMNPNAELRNRYLFSFLWGTNLRNELNEGRPIVYAGGSHTWVIDGYNENNQFHCIWGKSAGYYDDYFSLGGFNPNGSDYNGDEQAIFDLFPATEVAYALEGPDMLIVNNRYEFHLLNIADCMTATFSVGPHMEMLYGGGGELYCYVSVRATGPGISWIDATYNLDGQVVNAPRKYINCYNP